MILSVLQRRSGMLHKGEGDLNERINRYRNDNR